MSAYLLLLFALLLRPGILPHSGWLEFSAVGGSLLYFGARRSWREMIIPVVAFAFADYYLTTHVYSYNFVWQQYLVTWAWYAAAIVLGRILLSTRVSVVRAVSAAVLGPTSFFLASNYAVWMDSHHPGGMYAPGLGGLFTSYVAGLPFFVRDLASTGLVLAVAFGVPIIMRRMRDQGPLASHPTL